MMRGSGQTWVGLPSLLQGIPSAHRHGSVMVGVGTVFGVSEPTFGKGIRETFCIFVHSNALLIACPILLLGYVFNIQSDTTTDPSLLHGLLCNVVEICTQQFDTFNVVLRVQLLVDGMSSVVRHTHRQEEHILSSSFLKRNCDGDTVNC